VCVRGTCEEFVNIT